MHKFFFFFLKYARHFEHHVFACVSYFTFLFQISQLAEDVRRLQSSIGLLQENTAKEIARLEEELHDKRQHIMRLEARLDAQRDYEEVKRQLW